MRINYVIGSYGAKYKGTRFNGEDKFMEDYIKHILIAIEKCNTKHIAQITIMKPNVNASDTVIPDYYKIDHLQIPTIRDKVKIIECENRGLSYGQYLTCMYNDIQNNTLFDYYILTEDDYIPFINEFDTVLLSQYVPGSCLCAGINRLENNQLMNWSQFSRPPMNVSKITCQDFALMIMDQDSVRKLFNRHSYEDMIRDVILDNQLMFALNIAESGIKTLEIDHLAVFNCNESPDMFILVNFPNNNRAVSRKYNGETFNIPVFMPIPAFFDPKISKFVDIQQYMNDKAGFSYRFNELHSSLRNITCLSN
jgi:hypothetical protein